jgi:uncharacterized repeat protein (TIGR03803 family)
MTLLLTENQRPKYWFILLAVRKTVYKLTPSSGTWTYTSLYIFTGGSDGLYSFSNLVSDKRGNLYGTTFEGGANGFGVVFKIAP